MAGSGAKSERLSGELLVALLEHSTVREAAAAVGLSERTAYRYLTKPDFVERWHEMKRLRVEGALDDLQAATRDAVETLRRNLRSGVPSVEVRAAAAILDLGIEAANVFDIDARLRALEALPGIARAVRRAR